MTAGRSSRPGLGRRAGRAFFDRPADRVARDLLGATLRVRSGSIVRSVRILETEAYLRNDPASHAFRGPTARNRSMFSRPGTLYVYRIHQVVCANLVARRGEAVLVRAGGDDTIPPKTASGPGRLCRYLGISRDDDGTDSVAGRRVEVRHRTGTIGRILVGPRVGIRRAVARPLRFALPNERAVSRPRAFGAGTASPAQPSPRDAS